jgi:DNA-binding transcriptional LysR family regulator
VKLFEDELWFVMDPAHAWAVAGRVEREEIPRQNYILYARSSYTFQMVEEYFRDEEVELNIGIELGDMEAIKELVKIGLGVSILAPWIVRKELDERSLVALPLGRRKLRRHWGILCRRGKRPTLAEETFIRLCRERTEKLVGA